MAVNIVEILVKAKDMTAEGFAAADAQTSKLGESLSKIGLMAGAGLAVVGIEAAKMAIDFNSQMMRLGTQAGVAQNKMAGLKSGVLALAGQVGFSPDSLAESLYHVASNMASMGASSSTMLNVVKIAAEGAKVGGADLVDVTNALTAAVASGIPGVKNYSQAMGMLNATVGAGDMKMQDLAEAFSGGMVAVVKGYGLTLKDVGAALATFGDNNIRGAHAGTMLRMSVQALAVPVAAGAKQLAALGMNSKTLAQDMQSGGLLKALDDLQGRFVKGGITAKNEGEVITTIFGKKAGAGVAVLMEQLDRLRSKYPAITKGANDFGAAWKTTNSGLKQQLADLKGGFDALMISIGEKLIPVIQTLVSWMLKHKQTVMDLLAGLGILAAVLLTTAIAIKTVNAAMMIWTGLTKVWAAVTKVAAAAQWLLNIALDANPIGLIIIAIAALIAVVVLVTLHFKAFRVFWIAVWHDVEIAAVAAWHYITGTIQMYVNQVRTALSWFGRLPGLFYGWWMAAYHAVVNAYQAMGSFIRSIPGRILAALGDLGHLLWNAGARVIDGLVGGIMSRIGSVTSAISSIAGEITAHLPFSPAKKGPLSGAGSPEKAGRRIAQMLAQGLTSNMPGITTAAARMAGSTLPGGGMAAGAGGISGTVKVQLEWVGSKSDQGVFSELRKGIRVRGGLTKALGP
jgi:TP901 family phage tail tape measure protein